MHKEKHMTLGLTGLSVKVCNLTECKVQNSSNVECRICLILG